MLALLTDDDVKQISMGALNQVNLDLLQCEREFFFCRFFFVLFYFSVFAASEPVQGLQQDVLLSYFTKLREILDLFTSWDWPTYFHDYGKDTNKYKQVTPDIAILLLEKLVFCLLFFY